MLKDPSLLDGERIVRFMDRGPAYAVHLSSGESSIVQVIKHRRATGRHPQATEYRQVIKYGSNNWKRAVRLARAAKAAESEVKLYNVAIDYRSVGFPGVSITSVQARSADAAVIEAVAQLRAKHINLFVDKAIASLSGWNR
jgi:hypothetical protein